MKDLQDSHPLSHFVTAPPQGAAKDNPLSRGATAPPDQVEPCGLELLNCPFCGSEPEIIEEKQERQYTQNEYKVPEGAVFKERHLRERMRWNSKAGHYTAHPYEIAVYTIDLVTITCSNPSCMARNTGRKVHDWEQAVARWNQRA